MAELEPWMQGPSEIGIVLAAELATDCEQKKRE